MNSEISSSQPACACCGKLDAVWTALAPLGPLLLRVALGAVFFVHGSQKMFGWFGGHGYSATIAMMHDQMGIPTFFAALVPIAEFFGGLGVLVGLLTPVAAFGIFCVMVTAVFHVHLSAGFFAPKGFEYPLTLGLVALSLMVTGAGPWSLDALIKRGWRQKLP